MPRRGGSNSLVKAAQSIPEWVQYLPINALQLPLLMATILGADLASKASESTYGKSRLNDASYAAMSAALEKEERNRDAEWRMKIARMAKTPDMSRATLSDEEIQEMVDAQNRQERNQQISLHNQQIMAAQAKAAQQLAIAQRQASNTEAQSQQTLSGYTTLAQQRNQQAAQSKAATMAATAAQNQALQSRALMSKTITGSIQQHSNTIQNALAGQRAAISALAQNRDMLHAQALARDAMQYIPTMKTVAPVAPTRRLPPTVTLAQISR
jgi:hypothetical protein